MSATVEIHRAKYQGRDGEKANGEYEVLYCPPALKRCDTLKIGDRINAKYYENVVAPAEAAGRGGSEHVERGTRAGGTGRSGEPFRASEPSRPPSTQSTRRCLPSASSGPRDGNTADRVQDKEALAKVKVGDKIDITWTEAAAAVARVDAGRGRHRERAVAVPEAAPSCSP
jgi:hypothetical protein